MTAKELIEQLQKLDPETEIGCIEDFYADGDELTFSSCALGEFFVDEKNGTAFLEEEFLPPGVVKKWAITSTM